MMRRLKAAALLTMAGVTLAGCTATSAIEDSAETKLTATTPEASGTINTVNWGVPYSEPSSLDWIYDWDYGAANLIQSNLCEGLFRQNPNGSTTPALASSVATPDKTTYVYKLRDDVTFTDGSPMTADDVAFSLNRNITAAPPSYWGLWYQNVSSIVATGKYEVTVKLTKPDSLFNSVMTTPAGYVGEKAYIQAAGTNYGTAAGGVMCTGPFALKSWEKGQSITLTANHKYWDKSLIPKSSTFVFSFIPDPAALNSALLSGQLDGAWSMNLSSLKPLQTAKTGKVYLNAGTEVVAMQLNNIAKGPLADVRIRKALRDLIDYKGITEGVLGGFARPAKDSTPAATWGYAKEVFASAYDRLAGGKQDLNAAKALIEKAGAPSDPIRVAVNADDYSIVNVLTTIQASAEQIGLKIKVQKVPASEYTGLFYDPKARADFDVLVNTVSADTPDPLEVQYQLIPGSPYNFTGADDADWTKDLESALSATDDTVRAKATSAAGELVNDKVYSISIYSPLARVFLGHRVTGLAVNSLTQWYYPWAATVGAR